MIFEAENLLRHCNQIICEENKDRLAELYKDFEFRYAELLKYEGIELDENSFTIEFLRTKAQKCLLSKQISTDELIITRCYPSSKVVRADIEYMHSIPDGRLLVEKHGTFSFERLFVILTSTVYLHTWKI
jgi:hypothetical protein